MQNLKSRLIHAGIVFLSTFLTLLGAVLATGTPANWTLNFFIPLITSAVSAAVKALTDPAVPQSLGGTKRI